ncbi:Uncharacterised protein [Mycobacteroides abscessus subsp. abscessus]|nr:Uncharacterised protein [Mycobacteroides abscessus subsp. abscessus]
MPIPPFHSSRIARTSSGGASETTSSGRPSAALACGLIGTDFTVRSHTPPPALISEVS